MKIYWRIDVRKGTGWKTLDKGVEESRRFAYGWKEVAETILMHSGITMKTPDWEWTASRVCIWPANIPADKRTLDNLLFTTYGAASDARDQSEEVRPMFERLKEWGAITDYGFYPDGAGDTWYYDVYGVRHSAIGNDIFGEIQAFEQGWLAARLLVDEDLWHPDEALRLKQTRDVSAYNTALSRIRAAGGELAERLEAELAVRRVAAEARLASGEDPDYAEIQREHAEFSKFVMGLAAELDAGKED